MSLEITETADGRILEVHATGKLTKDAYERFVPKTEEKIREHGKIRVMFVMHDFHGWTAKIV